MPSEQVRQLNWPAHLERTPADEQLAYACDRWATQRENVRVQNAEEAMLSAE